MKILAHRGLWSEIVEKNSPQALRMALEKGYGFESDVRDYGGELVISHDIATQDCQAAEEVFGWLAEFNDQYCFAINVKADGLKEHLKRLLSKHKLNNYFLFDMSVPQMVEYADVGLRFYTRQSEIESDPVMYEKAAGVWIDGFWGTEWIDEALIQKHIRYGKEVCLVSPDLHNRDYRGFWSKLLTFHFDFSKLTLCTDHPDEAKMYFASKLLD